MHAVALMRVSTEEQLQGYSIAAQAAAIREYCHNRGWSIIPVEEGGESAWTDDLAARPGLQRALALIESGEAAVLIVHKLDRLARDKVLAPTLLRRIHRAGGKLVSLTEQWDFTTPQGDFLFGIMAGLNEYHSANLSTEVKKGKAARARSGRSNGAPPYGYTPTWEIDPAAAAEVRLIFDRYATDTASITDLAAALNSRPDAPKRWGYSGLWHLIHNRHYLGEVQSVYGSYPGLHPPIISPDTFTRVQEVAARRRRYPKQGGARNHVYPLGGLLRCADCKGPLYGSANTYRRKDGALYIYRFYEERPGHNAFDCANGRSRFPAHIPERQIRAEVQALVNDRVSVEEVRAALLAGGADDRAGRIAALERRLARTARLYEDDLLAEGDYQRKVAGLRAEIAALRTAAPPENEAALALATVTAIVDTWDAASPVTLRALLHTLIESIDFDVHRRRVTRIQPRMAAAFFVRYRVWSPDQHITTD